MYHVCSQDPNLSTWPKYFLRLLLGRWITRFTLTDFQIYQYYGSHDAPLPPFRPVPRIHRIAWCRGGLAIWLISRWVQMIRVFVRLLRIEIVLSRCSVCVAIMFLPRKWTVWLAWRQRPRGVFHWGRGRPGESPRYGVYRSPLKPAEIWDLLVMKATCNG